MTPVFRSALWAVVTLLSYPLRHRIQIDMLKRWHRQFCSSSVKEKMCRREKSSSQPGGRDFMNSHPRPRRSSATPAWKKAC
ncbi:hypothetical protein C2E26_10245 [Rhizobium sp. YIC5082]|nr:hypothetical protein C2E26_10245 [Rhizobium sp. YIC5082]